MALCMVFMVISHLAFMTILKVEQLHLQSYQLAQHYYQANILYRIQQQAEQAIFLQQLSQFEQEVQQTFAQLLQAQIRPFQIVTFEQIHPQLYHLTIENEHQTLTHLIIEQELYVNCFQTEISQYTQLTLYGAIDTANRHQTILSPLPSQALSDQLLAASLTPVANTRQNSQKSWQPNVADYPSLSFNLGAVTAYPQGHTLKHQLTISPDYTRIEESPIPTITYLVRSQMYTFE